MSADSRGSLISGGTEAHRRPRTAASYAEPAASQQSISSSALIPFTSPPVLSARRPARHPAVNARHSATARMSASSVTCAYSSSVVCTSAWPSRRDTTCTGTPASSKAVACECRIQCGVQAAGTCPARSRRSRPTRS